MPHSAEHLLQERVKALMAGRTQRSVARAIGVSDATMSDFLAGKHGLGLDKLTPLARTLGVSVADLFVPVQKSAGVPPIDTPAGLDYGPPRDSWGVQSAESDRRRLRELQQTIDQLRADVRSYADALRALASLDETRSTAARKARRRGDRRRFD